MRIVAISDLHDKYLENMPNGDVLMIAGDLTCRGLRDELVRFNDWLGRIKSFYGEIILTPGNHDFLFETDEALARSLITNATVLIHEPYTLANGTTVFGSPYSPWYHNWAYNVRSYKERELLWDMIPEDTEILLTHTPPYRILDKNRECVNCGDDALYNRLFMLPVLQLHLFGHIHEDFGVKLNPCAFTHVAANVSICGRSYHEPVNPVTVIDLYD